jgi:putative drug exporter of the RND superfamily
VLVGIGILPFRFREQPRTGHARKDAARGAAIHIAPVIASGALAVFGTLALAQFGELRALGPAIAASVAVMLAVVAPLYLHARLRAAARGDAGRALRRRRRRHRRAPRRRPWAPPARSSPPPSGRW